MDTSSLNMAPGSRNSESFVWGNDGRLFTINTFEISPPETRQDVAANKWCCRSNRCWNAVKSHPLCPSLHHFLRFLALLILTFMIWGSVYSELGDIAGPQGQLFQIGFLGVTAYIAGYITLLMKLPALLGMLLMGLLLRNINFVVFTGPFLHVTSTLRKLALLIIIIRAGLELDPAALKKMSSMVAKMLVIPLVIEAVVIAVMTYFLLDLPWIWGFLLGSLIAAISPAVVLSSLFQIQKKGNYGISKGIPTLVIAVTSLDDILCISVFGVLLSIITSTGTLTSQIISGPAGVAIGVTCGLILGTIVRFIPHENDRRSSMLRTLLLVGGGLLLIFGSEKIGFVSAGALGTIIYTFIASNGWDPKEKGTNISDEIVNENVRLLWTIFEPILFGLIGNEINIFILKGNVVGLGIVSLLAALLVRAITAGLIATGGNFNWREKVFISLVWIPKATVQAVLAPAALDAIRALDMEECIPQAEILLIIGALSILISAPLGSIVITTFGPKLLTKDDAGYA
ncbi:hypothetical protein L9F63_010397 [Diploptera punctata]|uniref:Cation/H+ exchanger transmembrane domain-containing protein n=1 Tax=Diploptera punctata TaxID=6984 RepID=A0AAD8ER86_DIPPU|nr:hypothetical protein L9F63_010397 [Diploptera punctata]